MPDYIAEPSEGGGRRQNAATLFFVLLGLVAINLPPGAQQPIAATLRATVLRPFVWTQESLTEARVTTAENMRLQAERDSLVAVTMARTHLVDENRRLRALLSLSERMGPGWTAASGLRSGTEGSGSIFHLDVGSNDGVSPNAAVITANGLVGQVREVRPTTSVAMDWTHPDFRVSGVAADAIYGMVEARRGVFREQDRLRFDGPYQTQLEIGTVVLTSGRGVYPRGIPVGRITEEAEAEAGWRRSYWLEPMVDPGSATHVLVLTAPSGVPDDVSAAWGADGPLTEFEDRALELARADSVPILRDSIGALNRQLQEWARLDSLRRSTPGIGGGTP